MATVDDLIDLAASRASSFASSAASAISAIGNTRVSFNFDALDVILPPITATYKPTNPDDTPMPVYTPPAGALPLAPKLVGVTGIKSPYIPTAPSVYTYGLFTQAQPSATMPDWNEANPQLHVDQIYDEISAVAVPLLSAVDFPEITPLEIGLTPTLKLPDYETIATPEAIPETVDYAAYMKAKYDTALPEMKAFIDGMVDGWVTKFAPEYYAQRDAINAKINAGLDNAILPDQFEAALYSRSRARVETEYKAAEAQILESSEKRGFMIPPGAVTSAWNKARLEGAKSLAGNSTDVYLERRKTEIQHLQFVMNLASAQIQSVRSLAVQYAGQGQAIIQAANTQADSLAGKLITRFEHERSRREFSLAVMRALNEQFEAKLKAALSGLEGFKLELEAKKAIKDVEFKQIEAVKLQIEAKQIEVQRYSAIVDAIAKKAAVDELKIKEYGIRADVFKTGIQARLASFEAYKASIDGDKAKLEGELAKLSAYQMELKAVEIQVDVQSKILDSNVKTNAALISQYATQTDVYKVASEVALNKFTAQAEIKKLGLDVYKTNVEANIEVYKGGLQKDIARSELALGSYKAQMETMATFFGLQQKYVELDSTKSIAVASGYSNMAAAALQSLNSAVSSTTSA